MSKRTFTVTPDNLRQVMQSVWDMVKVAVESAPVVVTLSRVSRSGEQNKKLHAMVADIARQVEFDGKRFGTDVWKAQLVDQFEEELRGMGKELSKPGKSVMSLDGRRVVQIRASTANFLVQEAADFIENLYAFGAENHIEWSDPETQAMYKEYFERTYNSNN